MTSAARTSNATRGFTLLEIVIVLAIGSILMSAAFGFMIYSAEDRVLGDASGEIESLAKQARVRSILHQTPYALEFREEVVRLLPLALAGAVEESKSRFSPLSSEGGEETREFRLDGGTAVFIRRWNTEQWLSTTKNAVHVWRFDPDGLCEPISVRLTHGKSWVEDTFHPLTASAILAEKRSEIR